MQLYKLNSFKLIIHTRIELGNLIVFRPIEARISFNSYLLEFQNWDKANRKILKQYSDITDIIKHNLYLPITTDLITIPEIKKTTSEKIKELTSIVNSFNDDITHSLTNTETVNFSKENEMINNKFIELEQLFKEAKQKSEFEFVLTLINYQGMGTKKLTTNLHEWFEAIEFYKKLYNSNIGKNKTRIGTLLYSVFFENSDFYNIIGSLCRIKLGYKGSSYLFWKTRKYERLLGIGEKQDFLLELLNDTGKQTLISFFEENHFKEIRNTFFHSAYSLSEEDYILHDSDSILINGIGKYSFNVEEFLFPKIENIIGFFDTFKKLYINSFDSYKEDKQVEGFFPNPVQPIILGSENGLQGFKIEKSVQFYGEWHDSGIWYREEYDMWAGQNINMYFEQIETIEIKDQLTRYENKEDIKKSNTEFHNLVDKVKERNNPIEIIRAVNLLAKFGEVRDKKMQAEKNVHKKNSYPKIILPYYEKAVELGNHLTDMSSLKYRIKELKK